MKNDFCHKYINPDIEMRGRAAIGNMDVCSGVTNKKTEHMGKIAINSMDE